MAPSDTVFILARIPRTAFHGVSGDLNLASELGNAYFSPDNHHQSLSALHSDRHVDMLIAAMSALDTPAFVIDYDRFGSRGGGGDPILWEFFSADDKPAGLNMLLQNLRVQTSAREIVDGHRHRPHVTVSYRAPRKLRTRRIAAVRCVIDGIELVRVVGSGQDYRYETIFSKRLSAMPNLPPLQQNFF